MVLKLDRPLLGRKYISRLARVHDWRLWLYDTDVRWPSLELEHEVWNRAAEVRSLTGYLEDAVVNWRTTVESGAELREVSRAVGNAAARITARYMEVESALLSVEGREAQKPLADTIAARFYEAQHIVGERIDTDPNVLGGKPYIRGTRIGVYSILEHLADGYSPKRIVKVFPSLTLEDVHKALLFAAIVSKAPWKKPVVTDA